MTELHLESSTPYLLLPSPSSLDLAAQERVVYFRRVEKEYGENSNGEKSGRQADSLSDLMTIRAFHSTFLRQFSLGTAVGFRTTSNKTTDIPAVIVFVTRKLHAVWLYQGQRLPRVLQGPSGIWCDVDVVEFSYHGSPSVSPKEQIYSALVEGLRGNDSSIGIGSQVASQDTYGTLGALVSSRIGPRQVGFLTNRHVAVDLESPNQKIFHPLPPNLGPGVLLGSVERATSFVTDEVWYGMFASTNPDTFVRADGAFVPFVDGFNLSTVTTSVKTVGKLGSLVHIDLHAPIGRTVGKRVEKLGRSSGLTHGTIVAYGVEYNDEKGVSFFTDLMVVGDDQRTFDLEGDSGSLIYISAGQDYDNRPIGMIWGGTANRGRLKLRHGFAPENWTSGVDLGRLLDLLHLDIINTAAEFEEALNCQRETAAAAVGNEEDKEALRIHCFTIGEGSGTAKRRRSIS